MGRKGFLAVIVALVIGVSVLGLGGCAGVQTNGETEMTVGQALTGIGTGYVIAMTVTADLYRNGAVDGMARSRMVAAGRVFYSGYTALVGLLETGDVVAVQAAIAQLSAAGSDLAVLVAALAGSNTAAESAVVSVTSILAQAYLTPALSAAITESGPLLTEAEAATLRALVKPPEVYFGLEVAGESD